VYYVSAYQICCIWNKSNMDCHLQPALISISYGRIMTNDCTNVCPSHVVDLKVSQLY